MLAIEGPRVPLTPQPLRKLQARYLRAVLPLIDPVKVMHGQQEAPSARREHVFDTEDGIRLIVSRDLMPDHGRSIHISVSLAPAFRERYGDDMGLSDVWEMVIGRWQEVARTDRRPRMLGISPGGVAHFLLKEIA